MPALTPFEALFITHFTVDWIFQWNWEAMNKSKNWLALLFHCLVYTVGFVPVFLIYNINLGWLLLIFISHAICDKRDFEIWILEKFKGFKRAGIPESLWNIVLIGVDQTLHLIILSLIVLFS